MKGKKRVWEERIDKLLPKKIVKLLIVLVFDFIYIDVILLLIDQKK